jgi:hypothetical protein
MYAWTFITTQRILIILIERSLIALRSSCFGVRSRKLRHVDQSLDGWPKIYYLELLFVGYKRLYDDHPWLRITMVSWVASRSECGIVGSRCDASPRISLRQEGDSNADILIHQVPHKQSYTYTQHTRSHPYTALCIFSEIYCERKKEISFVTWHTFLA